MAYKLWPTPRRLWVDQADVGFLHWSRFGSVVLMSAELELAAWSIDGKKLWSTFVEPPWDFTVTDDRVDLHIMGKKSQFSLVSGP